LQHGFRLINDAGSVISTDFNWEHLELRGAPWRYSYGLTQVFHRSILEFSDLWKSSRSHFDGQRMPHDQWIRFLSSLLGQTLSINEVLIHYRQHEKKASGDQGWGSAGDRVKQKMIVVDLARSLVDGDFKKKKRRDLIGSLENMVATASVRATIAQKVATRVGAESAGQAYQNYSFTRIILNIRPLAFLPTNRHSVGKDWRRRCPSCARDSIERGDYEAPEMLCSTSCMESRVR
jgi:hypothetical protein